MKESRDKVSAAGGEAIPRWAWAAIGFVALLVIVGGLFAVFGKNNDPAAQAPAQTTAVTVMDISTVPAASIPQAIEMVTSTLNPCAGATSAGARQGFTFEQIVPCLDTPQKIVEFMSSNLNFDPGWDFKTYGDNAYPPAAEVYVNGVDDCDGLAEFAACVLSRHGYEAYNVGVSILGPDGLNIAGYIDRDGLKYSIINGQGIDGPFNTWEELAQFYIDKKMAAPPDGVIWLFSPCIEKLAVGRVMLDLSRIEVR